MPEELDPLNKPNLNKEKVVTLLTGGASHGSPSDKRKNNNKDKDPPGNAMAGSNECEDFEQILEVIGAEGRFQKILLYAILAPIVAVLPFLFLNTIFMWDIPDHWCHVPGWDPQMMTLEEWKNATLPWEKGPDGLMRHSQCEMKDPVSEQVTQCQHGWEYDTTDYSSTIPSEYNWVCDKGHYATECFTWVSVGCAIGTVIFGIMADKFGRKPVFFLACAASVISKTVSLFLAQHYHVYKVLQLLGGFCYPTAFTMPALINVEVSGPNYRSWIYAVTWMIWVVGNALIPFVAMVCREWFLFGMVASVPGFFIFFYIPFLDESPRWLITVGKTKRATDIILKIAKTNGKHVDPDNIRMMVEQVAKKQARAPGSESVGVWTLFSKFRIAKNTIMLTTAWTMNELVYNGLTLNTTKMAGNTFINYFLLALVELPGGWVAGKLAEKTGRRWTQTGFFLMSTFCCLVCAVAVAYQDSALIVIIAAVGIKFGVSITALIVYLQGAEMFPTQLRSTGSGLASTVSSVVGIFGPYMVYSGTVHVSFPYALLCVCTFIGFMSSMCLPETLKQNLPETVEEANEFGKEHKFWSYLPLTNERTPRVKDCPQKSNNR